MGQATIVITDELPYFAAVGCQPELVTLATKVAADIYAKFGVDFAPWITKIHLKFGEHNGNGVAFGLHVAIPNIGPVEFHASYNGHDWIWLAPGLNRKGHLVADYGVHTLNESFDKSAQLATTILSGVIKDLEKRRAQIGLDLPTRETLTRLIKHLRTASRVTLSRVIEVRISADSPTPVMAN